jgi:hypothetical protein
MSKVIFDLTNPKCIYKGVLFAEGDNSQLDNFGIPPIPQKFAPGIMAVIWVDEEGTWHHKTRMKFPQSGNKQVFSKNYKKEQQQGINVNETYVLQDIYKFPMKDKVWTPNPSGEGQGILEIIEKLDMIESAIIIK